MDCAADQYDPDLRNGTISTTLLHIVHQEGGLGGKGLFLISKVKWEGEALFNWD